MWNLPVNTDKIKIVIFSEYISTEKNIILFTKILQLRL